MPFIGLLFIAIGGWFVDCGVQNRPPIGTIRDLIARPQPLADALASGNGTWQATKVTSVPGSTNASNPSSPPQPTNSNSQNGRMSSSELTPISWAPSFRLRTDAEEALEQLNNAYKLSFGHSLVITSAYRTYAEQTILYATKGTMAAPPGQSNHGNGTAVDLGGISYGNAMDTWMLTNAAKFGWHRPSWATPNGAGPHEPWHWEFAG